MKVGIKLPKAFSFVTNLGVLRSWHPVKKWIRVSNLLTFLLLMGASMLVIIYGVVDTYAAYKDHGPAMIDEKLLAPSLIAFTLFLFGLLFLRSLFTNLFKAAAVYERGFAYRDRTGVRAWAWADVASLTVGVTKHNSIGIHVGTTHLYTLKNYSADKLMLTDALKGVEQLAQAIEQAIFPRLYDEAAVLYNSGQTVVCGPVAINKSGLVIGRKTYPWSEVQQILVQNGILRASKKGGGWFKGASAAVSTIPNLRVVLSIIDQVMGVKTG